jgi:antirestriction protein
MDITTPTSDTTPRAWIGCLACYNEGGLVGRWCDAIDADTVTPEDIHESPTDHEELWCFDHENIPVRGEMDPLMAAAWGRFLAEVDDTVRPALIAWVETGDYVEDGDGLPSVGDFEERYCGQWDSFDAYAEDYVESTGLLADVPEEIARYFDYEAFARDLRFDYATCDAPDGGVYVFRSF